MSDNADEPRPEQGHVNPTQSAVEDIDWSQFYDMFTNIEQRLPNFDHMLVAMNDYAFQRTSRRRRTNDLSEFCGVIKKGFFDWYTRSSNNEIKLPKFIDLTNQVFDDDILMEVDKELVSSTSPNTDASESTNTSTNAGASKRTSKNPITLSHRSFHRCTHKIVSTSSHTTTKSTKKKAKISTNKYSAFTENTKYYFNQTSNKSTLEATETSESLSQSTEESPEESLEQSTEQSTPQSPEESTEEATPRLTEEETPMLTEEATPMLTEEASPQLTEEATPQLTEESPEQSTPQLTEESPEQSTPQSTEKSPEQSIAQLPEQSIAQSSEEATPQLTEESPEQSTPQSTEKSPEQSIAQSPEQSTAQSNEQSIETNVVTDHSFKIIMPRMTPDATYQRRLLPTDSNTRFGSDCERHWWRQTLDQVILHVDISDLIVNSVPKIKVVVTIIGFEVKIKRSNKWIVLVSNKFENAISRSKWVVNKYMHVKLTIYKREKEFWRKCLVTETRELNTIDFLRNPSSNEFIVPVQRRLKLNVSRDECLATLTAYLEKSYGMEDLDFDDPTETNPPATEENPEDPDINLELPRSKNSNVF